MRSRDYGFERVPYKNILLEGERNVPPFLFIKSRVDKKREEEK